MEKSEIERLEKLNEARSEGPDGQWHVVPSGAMGAVVASAKGRYRAHCDWAEDAEAIEGAVNALPDLLAAAKREGELREWVETYGHHRKDCQSYGYDEEDNPLPCTCGLDAILEGKHE